MTSDIHNLRDGTITHRLRCKYPLGPIMQDGEPEFGWRCFNGPAPEGMVLPTPLMLEAANNIDALTAEVTRQNARFDILALSVASALGRHGVTSVDDPGEAIDVLVAEKDQKIAQLREALAGVVRVADRKTVEFDAARAALSTTG